MNQNKLQVSGQFLYSFTVVAKHMSFTKAAEDLCITQSAVSHRIRCLEQELGFPLFHRLTRKIILTEEGKTLYGALDASLKQIHETIRNIQEAELQGDLVIACAPSIAGCWLLPLLPEFQHEHPNISLHIRSGNDLISYENEEGNADVAIYCGDSITDGLHATPLLRDNLLPVCSQRYAREHDLIENPEALRNCELIHEHPEAANTPFYAGWEIWANWAGITGLPLQSGYSFDRAELTAIAAKQGLGVALGLALGLLLLPVAVLLSRRYGSACYCLAVCPLGLVANWLGKIAPWRIRRTDACMHCLACIRVCRYGALTPERLKEGRPGPGCTLCRDCLSVCRHGGLAVTLYGKTCGAAESSFVVLLSIMHTVFLAVARV